jgi:alginate O-acetyltransferase complex protein AlgI
MLLVVIGWVFFRADGIPQAWSFLGHMFGPMTGPQQRAAGIGFYLQSVPVFMLMAAAFFSWLPVERGQHINFNTLPWTVGRSCVIIALILLSCAILATSAFNPFIYFRF